MDAKASLTQLTPENLARQRIAFKVEATQGRDAEGGARPPRDFTITVRARVEDPSPFVQATLDIEDGDGHLASCRVEGVRDKEGAIVYRFRVGAKALDKSRFTIGEPGHDARGNPMPSGDFYWFYIGAFGAVPAGTATK